jgi:hypothetical protein
MQNRENSGKKATIGVKKQHVERGGKYHFQKGGRNKYRFLDQNIDPWDMVESETFLFDHYPEFSQPVPGGILICLTYF